MNTSMMSAEKKSLLSKDRYQILDPETEAIYDHLVKQTAVSCEVSMAALYFTDEDTIWEKFTYGNKADKLTDHDVFWLHTLNQSEILEVSDILSDERFNISGEFDRGKISFYTGIPIMDAQGNKWGVLAIFDEKTKKLTKTQKFSLTLLAEQVVKVFSLRCSKMTYQNLIETSRDMVYELDEDAKFTFANMSVRKKTGYTEKELQQMTCWDLIPDLERETIKGYYLQQIKKGKQSIYHEFPIFNKEGKKIWLGQSVDFIFENGRATKSHAISKDITELVETRQRLKESEEQILAEKNMLRTMAFTSPASIAMFNLEFKYLAFSEKWSANKEVNEKVIGLIGLRLLSMEKEEMLDSLKERLEKGEVMSSEKDMVKDPEGNERWIKWVATPWNNTTDGSVGGIIIYTTDITELIKQKAELQQAKEEALLSGKIKEEFLSSMSHEIRTPLNAIIGTTNLLLDEKPELARNEKFNLLSFSTKNLLALINNILDFSKIESGKLTMRNKDFDIIELVTSLVNSWKPVASKKDIDLHFKIDPELPQVVNGDAIRISQVLNNLVNNALKFTEQGYVQLSILKSTKSDQSYSFEIKDTGIGISDENQKLVFESFEQVVNESGEDQGGTGLGLPICQNLLKMMDSELHLVSQEGLGSKFSFIIKLPDGDEGVANPAIDELKSKDLGLNVLLVEDNQANQFIAKSFLDKWGCESTIAINGKEAVDKVTSKEFDLILMDMRMPIMNGYEATQHIRSMEDPYFKSIPVIALTASTMRDIEKKDTKYDFNGYLGKPFDPKEFHSLLYKYARDIDKVRDKEIKLESKEEAETTEYGKEMIIQNLNEYTDGDTDFIIPFAKNIQENLYQAVTGVVEFKEHKSIERLNEMIHMVKPTFEIIGNSDLINHLIGFRENYTKGIFNTEDADEIIKKLEDDIRLLYEIIEEKSDELKVA